MTKTQAKSKVIAFATLVNHHLEIISKAQDDFDRELNLVDDEVLYFIGNLADTDEDCKALNDKYCELLEKIGF